VALKLKRSGITRVRPLHGGLSLWVDREYPTTELKLTKEVVG
jgi:3-mercaptopyruvate sulfurtransferase SseA